MLLALATALTLTRLLSYGFSEAVNPGVSVAAALLALLGGVYEWRRARTEPHELSSPALSSAHPSMFMLTRARVVLVSLALTCTLSALALHISMSPLRSLNPQQHSVINLTLWALTLEGLGVWAAWWAWWSAQPERARSALVSPLLMGGFVLPVEVWLRSFNEPLQALGADVGFWLIERVSDVVVLSGGALIELKMWDRFTFYSPEFYLIINETCAGVNLLLSSALYAVGFGWVMRAGARSTLTLLAWALPLALLLNGARVCLIFCLGHYGSVELAMGPWHEGSAYLTQLPLLLFLAWRCPSPPPRRPRS